MIRHSLEPTYLSDRTTPTSAAQTQATAAIDVWRSNLGSASVTLTGMTGTISLSASAQASNDVPPEGAAVGMKPANRGGWAGNPWQPDESSWVDQGNPVSISDNGTVFVDLTGGSGDPFLSWRWSRIKITYTNGVGGTLSVAVTLKGAT